MTVTHPSRPWNDAAFGPVPVPTMISREEQRYLYWLTSTQWTGEGVVVEMGPWLGGSTLCLAAGIRDSGHAERFSTTLHVFDDFVWREFMAGAGRPDLAPGASFEAHFRENLREHEGLLAVHRASLPDDPRPDDPDARAGRPVAAGGSLLRWTAPEPVEILYWVPLVLELLSDRLQLVHVLERNTVTFRLTAPLAAKDVEAVGSFDALPDHPGAPDDRLDEGTRTRLRRALRPVLRRLPLP